MWLKKNKVTAVLITLCTSSSFASVDVHLQHIPIEQAVQPNMMITLDDSNSMRYDITFSNENALDNYLDMGPGGRLPSLVDAFHSYDGDEQIFKAIYDHYGTPKETEIILMPVEAREADWRIRSADLNATYYDPYRIYEPMSGFPEADFTAVRLWPSPSKPEYNMVLNLDTENFSFFLWQDTAGYDTWRAGQDTISSNPNGYIDIWDNHTRFTFSGGTVAVTQTEYAPVALMTTCNPVAIGELTPQTGFLTCFNGTEKTLTFDENMFGRTLIQEKQNIANWFQYHRTRGLSLIYIASYLANVFDSYRYSMTSFFSDAQSTLLAPAVLEYDETVHNYNIIEKLLSVSYDVLGETYAKWTKTRNGLIDANNLLIDNTLSKSPIIGSCQQNFNLLISDGLETSNTNITGSGIGDEDGDGQSETLADITYKYYHEDQRPDLDDDVPLAQGTCPSVPLVEHQGIRTLAVAFGVGSELVQDSAGCWPVENTDGKIEWAEPGDTYFRSPEGLWFAAYNSAGAFVEAQKPLALQGHLTQLFASLYNAEQSASAATVSAGVIQAGARVYSTSFNLAESYGELKAFTFDAEDQIEDTPQWNANTLIASGQFNKASRTMYVNNSSQNKVSKLIKEKPIETLFSTDQLKRLYYGIHPNERESLLQDWIEYEKIKSLGTIVYSSPLFVGPSSRQINTLLPEEKLFNAYYKETITREPMVYIGTNDGFIHAFNALSGKEFFKLLPDAFLQRDLIKKSIYRQSRLNGQIFVADSYMEKSASWKTVLLASYGPGAKGIIALDITDPDTFSNHATTSLSLWELNSESLKSKPDINEHLGYIIGSAGIARLAHGKTAAIFGNGYNSDSGEAVLFIVDIETGSIVRTLKTGYDASKDPTNASRKNGLAVPSLIDSNGDGIVDKVYAGDFYGNMFAFDLSSENPHTWASAYGSHIQAVPLFSTGGAPITTKPAVIRDYRLGSDDLMVIFATGESITVKKNQSSQTEVLLGILDQGVPVTGLDDMNEIDVVKSTAGYIVNFTYNNEKLHWRVLLDGDLAGYKVTSTPDVQFGEARFTMSKTTVGALCEQAEESTIHLVLDASTGGGTQQAIFLDSVGNAVYNDEGVPISGIELKHAIQSVVTIGGQNGEVLIGNDSKAKLHQVKRLPAQRGTGRRSWLPLVD